VKRLKVLIGCESSGEVRDAFIQRGHNAMSCDLLPSERPGPHYQGDIFDVIDDGWDLAVFHPPCTFLAVSGYHWTVRGFRDIQHSIDALDFVRRLMDCNISRWALENPISRISSQIRKPDQVIQPWMFGHGEIKATCLWLKALPALVPTKIVSGREARCHKMPPGDNRWRERSRTLAGIADAMADQWGDVRQMEIAA
jgi:hypothetical protein